MTVTQGPAVTWSARLRRSCQVHAGLSMLCPLLVASCLADPEPIQLSIEDGPGEEYVVIEDADGSFRTVARPERTFDWGETLEEGGTLTVVRPQVRPMLTSFVDPTPGGRITIAAPAVTEPVELVGVDLTWAPYEGAARYEVGTVCWSGYDTKWLGEPVIAKAAAAHVEVASTCDHDRTYVGINAVAAGGGVVATMFDALVVDGGSVEVEDDWDGLVMYRRRLTDLPRDATVVRLEFVAELFVAAVEVDVRGRREVEVALRVPPDTRSERILLAAEDGGLVEITRPVYALDEPPLPLPAWPQRVRDVALDVGTGQVTWATRGSGTADWASAQLDADRSGRPEWVVYALTDPNRVVLPRLRDEEAALLPAFDDAAVTVTLYRADDEFTVTSRGR